MDKKASKNKKGFSLIELLAVLVILTIIMGITIPIISSSLKRNEVSQADINREKLETLTEMYITDNKEKIYDEMEQNQQSKCFVSLKTLINQGYLIDADLDVIGEENEYIIFEKPNHYTYTKNIQDIQNIRACSHEDEILNEAEYTVLLNQNGGKNGTESVLAIYNKPMPSINKPNLTYTINYDNNAPPNTKTEKLSSTVNYNFEGYWSKYDGTGTKYYTSTGTSAINYDIKGNSTLYAYWTSRSTALLTPTSIPGYTFEGWYKERTGETLIGKPNATYTPKENVNLYGKWSVNTYNITLNKQSGTGGTNTIYQKYAIGIYLDDKLKTQMTTTTNAITLPTRTGYTFQGYYTKTNGQGTKMINNNGLITSNFTNNQYTENTTLYAYWTINNYYVDLNWTLDGSNFNPKETSEACAYVEIGGTSKDCVTDYYTKHPHGTTYKITKIKLNGTDISYSYSGTINGNNLPHAISLNTLTISRNNTSYGTTSASTLYVKNGTTYSASVVDVNKGRITLDDGRTVTATASGEPGYTTTFKDWSSTSGQITKKTTVVANFNRTINNYKITLSANNSSYGTVSSTSVTVPYNSTYSVDSNNKLVFKNSSGTVIKTITATPTALAGHTTQFTGWDSISGTITADKTIKANFIRSSQKYTVTLNNQSATSAGSTSVTATYGSAMPSITKPVRAYTVTFNYNYTGGPAQTTATAVYTFEGYYTSAGGGGTQYYKTDGTSARNYDIASATTLYAKWGEKTITLPSPTRTGYNFLGWYTEQNGGTRIGGAGDKIKPTVTDIYYARWEVKTFFVGLIVPKTNSSRGEYNYITNSFSEPIVIRNLVTNGDFSSDNKGWTFSNVVTGNYIEFKTGTTSIINQTLLLNAPTAGNYYYGRTKFRSPSGFTSGDARFEWYLSDTATGHMQFYQKRSVSTEGSWRVLSSVQKLNSVTPGNWYLRNFVVNGSKASGVDDMMVIDVTSISSSKRITEFLDLIPMFSGYAYFSYQSDSIPYNNSIGKISAFSTTCALYRNTNQYTFDYIQSWETTTGVDVGSSSKIRENTILVGNWTTYSQRFSSQSECENTRRTYMQSH